jgi:hypothetical protein
MASTYYLQVGIFNGSDPEPLVPLSPDAVRSIAARFVDTDAREKAVTIPPAGELAVILGYIGGTPVAFHESGFVYLPGEGIHPRVEAFLDELCWELGCGIHVYQP